MPEDCCSSQELEAYLESMQKEVKKSTHKGKKSKPLLIVELKKNHESIKVPTKGSDKAAAFDVYATRDILLQPGETVIVPLGFAVAIPEEYDMKLTPRSGLSKKGVSVSNSPGLIDEDFRGEMGVVLRYDPANTYKVINKLYKSLSAFCKNLVSSAQFNLDVAKAKLADAVNVVDPFPPYLIVAGDRIGQVQIHKVVPFEFKVVEKLNETKRGTGGFGSTGA